MRAHRLANAELGDVGEVADVLVVLEDFLLHGGGHVVDELAAYRPAGCDDPQSWVLWVAGRLGEHAATLRALTPTTEATALPIYQPIGEPR